MRMRGSVHIVGPAGRINATFENNPPIGNPPKEVYYRRAVYQLALERLAGIVADIEGFDTKHTGKVYRNEHGEAVGRGKGIMPSIARSYPEARYWTAGPAALVKTIRQANTPSYFALLQGAVHQVEGNSGEQLELFVRTATRAQLDEIPAVLYPAHKGNTRCRHCQSPHAAALHRFHLDGSFDKTHPGPGRAAVRKEERDRLKAGLRDEVPF